MDILKELYEALPSLVVTLVIIAVVVLVLVAANWFLLYRNRNLGEEKKFPRRIAMGILSLLGCIFVLISVPIGNDIRTQLIGLLGLLVSVVITLSSTTFVANAMAGFMLRAVKSFRPGDFIQVGEQFGRVTERGLFHIEIQTEDRDLTTLPNLYLISNPVKVVRYSGTVVSATVSLGYDVPHNQVMSLLSDAAKEANLQDPFVQITELGDFSVTYRAAGFLTEVKQLFTVRSNLRAKIISTLHGAGVEIVSPNFMNQRVLREEERVLPHDAPEQPVQDSGPVPEELIFDKADRAEELEHLRMEQSETEAKIGELEEQLKTAEEDKRPKLEKEVARLRKHYDNIVAKLESAGEEE
ncbi:MAG: mechanosensitive ion channel [Pirellulales bacterium]|nr:mechanosensitive ion channel [Pirellulales bacterium]